MICPVCGVAELVQDSKKMLPVEWHGRKTMIEVHGDGCPACGEIVLTREESAKFMEQVDHLKNVGLSAPDQVRLARKKLGLSQKEAGRIFGGGVNAFSRYELGKVTPPKSLLLLLGLLVRHPEYLEDTRRVSETFSSTASLPTP